MYVSGINPTSYLIGVALATANQMLISLHLKRVNIAVISWLIHQIMIMTNIDFDHPDYYKSIEDVFQRSKQWLIKSKGNFCLW